MFSFLRWFGRRQHCERSRLNGERPPGSPDPLRQRVLATRAVVRQALDFAGASFEDLAELLVETAGNPVSPPAPSPPPSSPMPPRVAAREFLIDTLFLAQVFAHCCPPAAREEFREEFAFAAGYRLDASTYTVQHLADVTYTRHTATGLDVEPRSAQEALGWMDRAGAMLTCHFHSHPGGGPPLPSAIDLEFQRRLDAGGHQAVGGIFTADGFLTFYSSRPAEFSVRILGKHLTEVNRGQHIYRLSVADAQLSRHLRQGSVPRGSRPF